MGKLRWLLPVIVAGCATTGFITVADSDYRKVPPAERTAIDATNAKEVAQANAELHAATAARDAARARIAAPAAARKPAAPNDEAAHAKADALARVDAATLAQRRAELAWRERRLAVAQARFAVLAAERELARARAIDRHLEGDDTYAVGIYRGQLAHAQEAWYAASAQANSARAAVEHTGAGVASAKEAYAQIVRADGENVATAQERLQLSPWSTKPADSLHRRGAKLVSTTAPLALHGNGLGHRGPRVPHLGDAVANK